LSLKISDGWDEDFKNNSAKFVDPTDKFKAMLNMRNQMMHMRDDMTDEEIQNLRHEMHQNMRNMPFDGRCRPDFDGHRPEGFGHGHRPDFHNNFWNGNKF